MGKIDDLLIDFGDDVAEQFGGDTTEHPISQKSIDIAKKVLASIVENIDPDLPYDIMYFFTDTIYAEHSLDEKLQLAKERINEYHERVKNL